MFVPFLIMLREGLEAALIVSLIASYLKRTQRGNWIGVMWIGVFLAAALCLGLGIFINETTGEFPQREQELFEGIVALVAVFILTWMVFWMRKVSRNVKQQLEQAVDNALQRGNNHGWALVMMVFFAVAREGLESVFSCWRRSSRMSVSGRRWARYLASPPQSSSVSCCTGAASALTSVRSSSGPACLSCWSPRALPPAPFAPFTRPGCGTTSRTWRSI
ncbi:Ferrous iron uptake protein [Raoultella terrigena]|uniref:Ferrous iron uptake protein n=1 Tax=Raoultella terrigena TaxID=577 RepID=A0A4U9DHM0_RAOTE|nr:Ferrous iron uptake protein [Raoultella terrigena]